jgi:hypothetical protein
MLNYNLNNPTPFIKKYISKHNHIINKFSDLLFSDPTTTKSSQWNSLPPLTQKLTFELSLYKLENGRDFYL